MDNIYQSKGLKNALLMQEADVGFNYCTFFQAMDKTSFLLDKTLKFKRDSNELKISHLPNRGAMNPYMNSNLTFKINSCTNSSSSL
jgi:hypothetical protein